MVTLRHILSLCALLLFAALSTPPADAARAHDATYDNNQAAYPIGARTPIIAAEVDVFAVWGGDNCTALTNGCLQDFAADQTYQTMMDVAQLGIEFLPVIGDTIAFADCGSEMSLAACAGAVVALVPIFGDGARLAMRKGDDLFAVAADGSTMRLLDDGVGAARPDLPEGHQWAADPDGNAGIITPEGTFVSDASGIERIVAPNRTFDFSTNGSGTHFTRTTSIDGAEIQINSGHAYNRTHSGGDVSNIGTMDEIEGAILNDISSNSKLENLSGFGNQHTIQVNGQTVIYELSDTPIGPVISNYYPPNP